MDIRKSIEKWDAGHNLKPRGYDYFASEGAHQAAYETAKALYETKWSMDRPFGTTFDAMIEEWLENFRIDEHRRIALRILPRLMFYSSRELDFISELAFREVVRSLGKAHGVSPNDAYLKDHVVVAPMTDGGTRWVRHVRHKFGLHDTTCLTGPSALSDQMFSDGNAVVIFEDFVGTGTDAIRKYKRHGLDKKLQAAKGCSCFLVALVATSAGIRNVRSETLYSVIVGQELDSRYKCFAPNSALYPDAAERAAAEHLSHEYGSPLCDNDVEISGFPHGFGDSQLTVVLWDNTPDDSLPILWYPNKGWTPLYARSRRYHAST